MDSNAFRTTSDPSPESQKITNQIFMAGLLAFLVAGAFPLLSVIRTVAKMASNYFKDYSCGDSSGIPFFLQMGTGIPF